MIVRVLPRDLTLAQSMALDVMDRACFPNDAVYPKHAPGSRWWIAYDDRGEAVAFAGLRIMGYVSFLCRCGVLPEARGHHVQRRLLRVRLRYATRAYPSRVVVTYTMPRNVASANNLIACGMRLWTPAPGYAWAGRDVLYWRKDPA